MGTEQLEAWIKQQYAEGKLSGDKAEELREIVLSIMVQQYRRGFDHATGKDRLVAA